MSVPTVPITTTPNRISITFRGAACSVPDLAMLTTICFFNRMLKKPVGFALASLRSLTYRSVLLASSLAAASPGDLFEYPADYQTRLSDVLQAARSTKTELSRHS
jgi:hypothetical protein